MLFVLRSLNHLFVTLVICFRVIFSCNALSVNMLYGVQDSKWSSPKWNWGYAMGSGHDCAMICRNKWSNIQSRKELIQSLIRGDENIYDFDPEWLDELKLILGLCWQRGRRDGSDGGIGGYSEVLDNLSGCQYETFVPCDDGVASKRNFLNDMRKRFELIAKSQEYIGLVMDLSEEEDDLDISVKICSGAVLDSMNFIEWGI